MSFRVIIISLLICVFWPTGYLKTLREMHTSWVSVVNFLRFLTFTELINNSIRCTSRWSVQDARLEYQLTSITTYWGRILGEQAHRQACNVYRSVVTPQNSRREAYVCGRHITRVYTRIHDTVYLRKNIQLNSTYLYLLNAVYSSRLRSRCNSGYANRGIYTHR